MVSAVLKVKCMNTISEQIKRFRNKNGLTQEQLGASVGVSMQAVSKWERGGTPDIELLPAIADVLDVSIDELFGRKQKSLEETISEVIYAVDSKKSYEYAFELCWAIFTGLAHISGNIQGRHAYKFGGADSEQSYFSKLVTDDGIACARIAPGFRTFFLMPQPKGSLHDKLVNIDTFHTLFKAFSDPDLLKILFNLYTRPNMPVDATFVSKETGIPLKQVDRIMDVLCDNQLLYRSFGTTAKGDIAFYMYNQESAVLPLLCYADEIQTTDMRDLVVDFSRRKPLF